MRFCCLAANIGVWGDTMMTEFNSSMTGGRRRDDQGLYSGSAAAVPVLTRMPHLGLPAVVNWVIR